MAPVVKENGRVPNSNCFGIANGKFDERQEVIPSVLPRPNQMTERVLAHTIHTLHLAVDLHMEGQTPHRSNGEARAELPPQMFCKLGPAVGNHFLGQPMSGIHTLEEQACSILGRDPGGNRSDMHHRQKNS